MAQQGLALSFLDTAGAVLPGAERTARGSYAPRRSARVVAPRAANKNQGWFYNKFVKENTFQYKLDKMYAEAKARKGKVDTLFDNSFKYTAWLEVFRVLTELGQKSVPPAEAYKILTGPFSKAVLLDVREAQDFAKATSDLAVSAPLFRLITGNDYKANIRRLGYALIADFAGTERNPDFLDQALAAVGGDKRRTVIVMCGRGGTLNTKDNRKNKNFTPPEKIAGIASRSLKACYELREAGFTNVIHLQGGLNQWFYDGFE